MSVEKIIVDNSEEQIKALMERAIKASETPDHGVKILNKGAYYVIRDCAKITKDYLPVMLYGYYVDPIKSLKKKFTSKDISAFVAKKDVPSIQLCKLMIMDALKVASIDNKVEASVTAEDDIYGDYGSEGTHEENPEFDFGDKNHIIEILTKAFEVKN